MRTIQPASSAMDNTSTGMMSPRQRSEASNPPSAPDGSSTIGW